MELIHELALEMGKWPDEVEAHLTGRGQTRWAVVLRRKRERERKELAAAVAMALTGKK